MTDEEKKLLLKVARNAIEHSLGITDEVVSIPYEGVFETMSGCFVTLHKHGDLRGCIGFIKGVEPLRKTIKEAALLAAKEDPRFSPVTAMNGNISQLRFRYFLLPLICPIMTVLCWENMD
jgi:uncharacterized protein (TIGR00296 family)